MFLLGTSQAKWSSPCNVPDMFLPVSRYPRPQCHPSLLAKPPVTDNDEEQLPQETTGRTPTRHGIHHDPRRPPHLLSRQPTKSHYPRMKNWRTRCCNQLRRRCLLNHWRSWRPAMKEPVCYPMSLHLVHRQKKSCLICPY